MHTPETKIVKKELIRTLVRSTYDLQKLRIMMGNRVTAAFKDKLGFKPGEKQYQPDISPAEEEELEDMDGLPEGMTPEEIAKKKKKDRGKMKILKILKDEYTRITDGIIASEMTGKQIEKLLHERESKLIDSMTELELVRGYMDILTMEQQNFNRLKYCLRGIPIFDHFLENVPGIGPAMAGVIVSEFDIHQAKYPTSLWRYAGLDVVAVEDEKTGEVKWEGKSMRKTHMVEQTYVGKDGEEKTKMGLGYNPFLKTKLMGVVADSFVKQKPDKCVYRKIYDGYKHRLQNAPQHATKTKKHIDNMAKRYIVKMFLADLYNAWRPLEGLEVHPPYSEAKLGMKAHGAM